MPPGVGPIGWIHLALFGVLLPLGAWRGKRKLESGIELPPRHVFLRSTLVQLVLFATVSLLVAHFEEIPLFPAPRVTLAACGFALALFALHAVVGWFRVRARFARRDPKLWLMMPMDGRERALWTGISLTAGVGEELTYRGVLIVLLQRLGLGFESAVVLCALIFGVSHAAQSWAVAAIVTGYAIGMHLLVQYSGSLYLGMALHFLHDLWIGLYVSWMAQRAGWDPQPYARALPDSGKDSS